MAAACLVGDDLCGMNGLGLLPAVTTCRIYTLLLRAADALTKHPGLATMNAQPLGGIRASNGVTGGNGLQPLTFAESVEFLIAALKITHTTTQQLVILCVM